MNATIKIGYVVESGLEAFVPLSHLIATGVTQLSGKTTTLEALIDRSKLKAIVFKTKIGEKSFGSGLVIPPFFRDRSDYEFVKSLMEAYNKEKLSIERGTLMTLCKGSKDLIEIKRRVDEKLNPMPTEGKKTKELGGIMLEIYTRLQHYLDSLIPQIKYANFSSILNLQEGINIMNLEQFSDEAQSLIIQSTADEVLKKEHGVIIVIPEAWKFLPQKYNNPCKRSVEAFIRQGATNNNFVWIDSQDMSGVDKIPLKSISTWILGYQSERNEVKHTLDQISLPKKSKPTEEAIMTLRKGHFYVSGYEGVMKIYVQPKWLDDQTAKEVALGKIEVENVIPVVTKTERHYPEEDFPKMPQAVTTMKIPVPSVSAGMTEEEKAWIKKELNEIRTDFFNKVKELYDLLASVNQNTYNISQLKPIEPDVDEIVAKVLQKMPAAPLSIPQSTLDTAPIDKAALIKEILSLVPSGNEKVYHVAPLEKIRQDFLKEAKDKILSEIAVLPDRSKKVLKYIEVKGVNLSTNNIAMQGLFLSSGAGGNATSTNEAIRQLSEIGVAKRNKNGTTVGTLRERIEFYLNNLSVEKTDIDNIYNHILAEMLGE